MEIRNRLFPYPVLCVENDDYVDCQFDIKITQVETLKDIVLQFEVILDNKEILDLIRSGKAEYLIHIECPTTSYRNVVKNVGNFFEYRISKAKVNNIVYLVGMVVAKETIRNFVSNSFNEDYDESVSFEKGAILAYRNLSKLIVIKNYEELAHDESFFTIVSKNHGQDIEEPITYDMNGPKIRIFVDEPIYNEYIKFQTNLTMRPIMISLLVMPALAYVIEEIRNNGVDNYLSCYWYQKLKKSCELQNKSFVDDIIDSDATTIEIAQELLLLPIGKAFTSLSTVVEE